jgi:hypothetical protein
MTAVSLDCITNVIKNFGITKFDNLKPFINEIHRLSGEKEANSDPLKTSMLNFFKEAYRWLGDSLKLFCDKLKKPIMDELEKYFESNPLDGQIVKPLRISA